MLAAKDRKILSTQTGEESQVQCQTCLTAQWVTGLKLAHLIDRPCVKSIARLEPLDAEGWVATDYLVLNGPAIHGRDDLHDLILGAWRRTEFITNFKDVFALQKVKRECPPLAPTLVIAVADLIENR
ncbi:hypothetical protein MesoLj131c_16260 [Mesorhizobium sp. 131-3-5]|nr:hypothetical protein MesoLj131c_16260 [Mesorhizobium sp. 131-3-5]